MKRIYPRLALTGMSKNKRLYIPYIFSCIGSVVMYYIVAFLSESPAIMAIRGGNDMSTILGFGKFVIAVFSLIFLTYTNSFLIRRRNKEFGLYNMLGMDKKRICRILVWEALVVAAVSISAGLFFGIALSKLAELSLLYLCHEQASYTFAVPVSSVLFTVTLFLAIFAVLLVKSVVQVLRSDPIELVKSENVGEKPPKANWIFALGGVLLLGGAYYMSVTIKSPLSAVFAFMIAVIMVIVATYLLFISGSVALCKLLQKNKKYYYKKNHFVSVSSMAYRMKRNGAGLASICILSTMVLVMAASTSSLYFGAEDSIKARYPQENQVELILHDVKYVGDNFREKYTKNYTEVFDKNDVEPVDVCQYGYASIVGLLDDEQKIKADASNSINGLAFMENLRGLYFMSQSDYNRLMGTDISIKDDETMSYALRCDYDREKFEMNGLTLNIKGQLKDFPELSNANVNAIPSIMFVVKDLSVLKPIENLADYNGDQMLNIRWYYGYNLEENDVVAVNVFKEIERKLSSIDEIKENSGSYSYTFDCLPSCRNDFYVTFGSFFFVGGLFSIMFIFAMAMIIYYKQLSEGFEDMERFGIMQKVGMTKKEIRKSINSQTLTVFFAPLLFAGLHFGFSFPPIWKLLQLFNLRNLELIIIVSIIAFAVFGLIYLAIYKATAKAYYNIVSAGEDR